MTTPYVTGTVSVTAGSPVVTGTGTGWLISGLVAGQFGLDSANGNPIPVLSVDSDTQITLAKPWRGTSATGQAYWITYDTTPGQQTVANAQRLAEYIARLDKPALAALASLIPAADKLPYFGAGGAGALFDFNAAARALLTGGQLPNGQVRNDLTPDKAFRRGNILGSVAQASGIPTGAIIERGSNANGEYTRLADGTQECFVALEVPYATSFDLSKTWTYPAAFAFSVTPVCTPTDNWYGGTVRNYILNSRVQANTNTSCVIVASNTIGNNQPGDRVTVFAHAKGRWY